MARVSYVTTEEAEGDAREVFTKLERRGSDILNLNRVLAHSPNVLRNFMRLGNSLLFHGVLPPRLRELAILRVAELTRAQYEWAHHVPIARQAGVRQEQAAELTSYATSTHFDARERAVLAYADSVTSNVGVPDEVFSEARTHLSEAEIVELTLVAGYWGMVARLLVALQIDVEPPYDEHLPAWS